MTERFAIILQSVAFNRAFKLPRQNRSSSFASVKTQFLEFTLQNLRKRGVWHEKNFKHVESKGCMGWLFFLWEGEGGGDCKKWGLQIDFSDKRISTNSYIYSLPSANSCTISADRNAIESSLLIVIQVYAES